MINPVSKSDAPIREVLDDVVLVFACYKQAQYLRQTLASAMSQSVYPHELLILDDASPDNSEQIIREMIATADPALNIQYCRNTQNVGLMSQLNSLRERYQNKLVVLQAGDDISKPGRLARVHEEWLENDKPSLVLSNYDEIDDAGNIVRAFDASLVKGQKAYSFKRLLNRRAGVFGCTAAISSDLLQSFPPVPKNVINEDRVFSFRALLKRGVAYIHEPLIDYRVGVGISARTEESYLDYLVREAQRELIDLNVNRSDALQESRNDLVRKIDKRIKVIAWVASLEQLPTFRSSWRTLFNGVAFQDYFKFLKRIRKRS
jgi:glycosyltransferase involved in cell wall biosynthesis